MTPGERSRYSVSLDELERSAQVPVEDQVTTQPATAPPPGFSEFQLPLDPEG